MTDNTQPEALRLAGLLELAPEDGVEPQTTEDAATELRRLHAEHTTLQAGYAAARLEIESLQARIKTMTEEQAELRRLSGCCPELNLSNYGPDDVDELNGWAIEVSQCIDRALAAQPAGAQQPGSAYVAPGVFDALNWVDDFIARCNGDDRGACESVNVLRRAFASHGQAPAQAAPAAVAWQSQETCQTCQGNGEVITDWERYKHPLPGDVGDEAVAECQDCDGQGTVDAAPTTQAAPAAVAGPSDVVSIQRQAFIRGWDERGMAHQLKGTVETDERMRVLMDIYFPRTAAPTTQPAGADRHGLPPLPDPDLRDVGTTPRDIKEFLRGYATEYALTALTARAPADSVLEDAARLDWLDQQCEGYGFQDIHEGNRWEISGPYANVRQAIDYERAARKQGANHD